MCRGTLGLKIQPFGLRGFKRPRVRIYRANKLGRIDGLFGAFS